MGLWRPIQKSEQRSLLQIVGVYLGGSWGCYEVIEFLAETLFLPDWVPSVALALFIIGLPFVLVTGIVQSGAGLPAEEPTSPARATVAEVPGDEKTVSQTLGWRPFLTWRNIALAGVAALTLLAVAAAGYMAMRALGIGPPASLLAKGALEARDKIILSDFANRTTDSALALLVTDILRTDLEASPAVSIADREYVGRVLRRMRRDPGAALDPAVAREVAMREGLKAVIEGEIGTAGSKFALSARLVSASSGEVLASVWEPAKDSEAIVDAIDRLSRKLRERVGESLRTIRRSEPLAEVTTSSLEALKLYSQANRALYAQADVPKAVALYEGAIALDSAFATAHRGLALALMRRSQQRTRVVEALTKAYEHRDRLTARERYLTLGVYYSEVVHDIDEAITVYRSCLDSYPHDAAALNNLAGLYSYLRDYERAESLYERALELDSTTYTGRFSNLITVKIRLGKFDDAEALLLRFARTFPGHPIVDDVARRLAISRLDYGEAEERLRSFWESVKGRRDLRLRATAGLASLARLRGRLAEADRYLGEMQAIAEQLGLPGPYLGAATTLAGHDIWLRKRRERGLNTIESALSRYPLETLPYLDRPYLSLALIYAIAQEPQLARDVVSAFEAEIDLELRRRAEPARHRALGLVAIAEGRVQEAISEFHQMDVGACSVCALPYLVWAYDAAGEADSVIAIGERYHNRSDPGRLEADSYFLPFILRRLAMLYEERGQLDEALHHYRRFVDLWTDADSELQPQVEAARDAIRRYQADAPA